MSETHIQLSSKTAVAFGPQVSNSVLPQMLNAKLHTVVSTPHPPLHVHGLLPEKKPSQPTTNSQLPSMHCTRVRSSLRQSYAPLGAGMEQLPFHSQPPLNAPPPAPLSPQPTTSGSKTPRTEQNNGSLLCCMGPPSPPRCRAAAFVNLGTRVLRCCSRDSRPRSLSPWGPCREPNRGWAPALARSKSPLRTSTNRTSGNHAGPWRVSRLGS